MLTWRAVSNLNVRSAPALGNNIVGSLRAGTYTRVDPYTLPVVADGWAWYRLADGSGWVAVTHEGGAVNLRPVGYAYTLITNAPLERKELLAGYLWGDDYVSIDPAHCAIL